MDKIKGKLSGVDKVRELKGHMTLLINSFLTNGIRVGSNEVPLQLADRLARDIYESGIIDNYAADIRAEVAKEIYSMGIDAESRVGIAGKGDEYSALPYFKSALNSAEKGYSEKWKNYVFGTVTYLEGREIPENIINGSNMGNNAEILRNFNKQLKRRGGPDYKNDY